MRRHIDSIIEDDDDGAATTAKKRKTDDEAADVQAVLLGEASAETELKRNLSTRQASLTASASSNQKKNK